MNSTEYFKKDIIGGGFLNISENKKQIDSHKYFQYTDIRNGMVSYVSLKLTNVYLNKYSQSINNWRKDKRKFQVYNNLLEKNSNEINYLIISNVVRTQGYFNPNDFSLPWIHECWIDHSNNHRMTFHKKSKTGEPFMTLREGDLEKLYNNKFPLKPQISREGVLLTSFFEPLIDKIIKQRTKLIETSNQALTLEWLFGLRELVNDAISSIDILLNTVYTKAEIDPIGGWNFDKEKMGEKYGRRLTDKLKWIYQISGNYLDLSQEKTSLTFLKDVRNHLNHFDPPCFAVTLEEVAQWFNMIIDIGIIHIKIREALFLKPSNLLLNFILQKEVAFIPEEAQNERVKLNLENEGYSTSTWKKKG